jgi:hypothetical protein
VLLLLLFVCVRVLFWIGIHGEKVAPEQADQQEVVTLHGGTIYLTPGHFESHTRPASQPVGQQ